MAKQRSWWGTYGWAGGPMDDDLNKWLRDTEEQVTRSALRLREIVEKHLSESMGGAKPEGDPVESLQALKRMRDLGLISDDEYEQKKQEILSRL